MPSIGLNLRVTTDSKQGGRVYMEDVIRVGFEKGLDGKEVEFGYFAVFDGHGGVEAAQFAREHLLAEIRKLKGFWSYDDEQVLKAIKLAFINTHKLMWNAHMSWARTTSGYPSTSGTTSSVVVIRNQTLYIAHVGDSSVVLGSATEGGRLMADCLTDEHKPNSPKEISRIRESGGSVMAKAGVNRVVWQRPKKPLHGPIRRSTLVEKIPFLAVARSLGDLWSYNFQKDVFVVSPDPDTVCLKLDPDVHKCLVIASDGLWNVIKPQSAIDVIEEVEKRADIYENTKEKPASLLVKLALRRWDSLFYRADNTSVICVMIDPPGPSTSRQSRSPSIGSSVSTVKLGSIDSDAETTDKDVDMSGSDCDIDLDDGDNDDMSLSYEVGRIFPRLCGDECGREQLQNLSVNNYGGSPSLSEQSMSVPLQSPAHCAARTPCSQQGRLQNICAAAASPASVLQQGTQTVRKLTTPTNNILMEAALNAPPFLEPAVHVTSPQAHCSRQSRGLLHATTHLATSIADPTLPPSRILRPRSPHGIGENSTGNNMSPLLPVCRVAPRFHIPVILSSSFNSHGSSLEPSPQGSARKADAASRSRSTNSLLWPMDLELEGRRAKPNQHPCAATTNRDFDSGAIVTGGVENVEHPKRGRNPSRQCLGQGVKRRASSSPASLTDRRIHSLRITRRSGLQQTTPNTRAHFKSPKKPKA